MKIKNHCTTESDQSGNTEISNRTVEWRMCFAWNWRKCGSEGDDSLYNSVLCTRREYGETVQEVMESLFFINLIR